MVAMTMDGALAAANDAEQDWREWVMGQLFVAGAFNDVLTVEQIKERVAGSGVDMQAMMLSGKAVAKLVRSVAPGAVPFKPTLDGKQRRCWRGIRFAD